MFNISISDCKVGHCLDVDIPTLICDKDFVIKLILDYVCLPSIKFNLALSCNVTASGNVVWRVGTGTFLESLMIIQLKIFHGVGWPVGPPGDLEDIEVPGRA